MNQREYFFFDNKYKTVRGYFYISGKRLRRRVCSFKDAGLDDLGLILDQSKRGRKRFGSLLEKLHRKIERGLLVGEEKRKAHGHNISTLFQEWLDFYNATRRPKTFQMAVTTANKYLKIVGNHPITETNLRKIDKIITTLSDKGLSPASINVDLKNLRAFFNWCVDREELEKSPKIKLLQVTKKIPRIPPDDAIKQVLNRITGLINSSRDPRHRRFYQLHHRFLTVAIGTGMRRSEIFYLPWGKINLDKGEISVLQQSNFQVKEKREKIIPMPGFLINYLGMVREENPKETWLIDDGKGQLASNDPHSFSTAIGRHYKNLGITNYGKVIHGFRARYATQLWEAGTDLATIQGLLGHSNLLVTAGYFGSPDAKKRQAVQNLPALFVEELSR